MAYRLRRKESVERGVRRIAVEQIDLALAQIEDPSLDREEAVHQVRKHCKKARGLLRLVRPQLKDVFPRENACYRDAARELSSIRDAGVLLEAWDKLVDRREGREESSFDPVRAALEHNRRRLAEQDDETIGRLSEIARNLRQARERVSGWSLRSGGISAIGGGLKTTYRRGRRAMQAAHRDPTTANFHEWRKWTKYHWYHMRLLRNLWPEEMSVRRDGAKELSDLLGDEHDLFLLRDALLSGDFNLDEFDVQPLLGLIERRRLELQSAARPLGLRLFAEKPAFWVQRCQGYWKAWKKEGRAPGVRLPAGA